MAHENTEKENVNILDISDCGLVLSQGCDEYLEDAALSQVTSEAEEVDAISQVVQQVDMASSLPTSSIQSRVLSTLGQSLFTNCNIKNVTINIIKTFS